MNALELATKFHEAYERLAPQHGYETRPETRTFDPESPNGKLMVAVCREVLAVISPWTPYYSGRARDNPQSMDYQSIYPEDRER